jgi:hypothetical protein
MLKQVYRLMKSEDPGYPYVSDKFRGNYIFQAHELEEGKFFVILITKIENSNKFAYDSIKALPFIFNKMARYSKIPIWLNYADKILFFNRNSELIKDIKLIRELYTQTWIHEFLYTKQFISVNSFLLDFLKMFYHANEERLKNFKYPETENPLDKKVYGLSALLDKSDLELGKAFYSFLQLSKECYDLSHDLSHNPSNKKIQSLQNKLYLLEPKITKIKDIISEREKIWLDWDLVLKEYLNRKNKWKRIFLSFIIDVVHIPFLSSLLSLISEGLNEIKDNVAGHKSLQNSLNKYEKLIKFAEQYQKDLFEVEFPEEKLIEDDLKESFEK